jgi:hypothetical protein
MRSQYVRSRAHRLQVTICRVMSVRDWPDIRSVLLLIGGERFGLLVRVVRRADERT